jgi:hypothetical protein
LFAVEELTTETELQIMRLNGLSKNMAALLLGGSVLAGTSAVVLTVHASDQASKGLPQNNIDYFLGRA